MSNNNTKVFFHVKQLKDESKFKEALQIINELEKKHNYTTEEKFEIYLLKSSLLFELGYFNEFFKYIDLADKERSQIKDKLKIFDFLVLKSKQLLLREENDEVLKILTKAEQMLNNLSLIEFKEKNAIILLYKARYYFKTGDFKRSIEYVYNVLKIAKEIKNNMLRLQAVKLCCFNYSNKGNHKKALEIGNFYLELARKEDNKQEIIGALNVLGMTLTEKEELYQALDYLKQALSICDEISSFKTAAVLTSLFDLYLEMNDFGQAEQCLNRLKKIKNQKDFRWFDDAFRLGKAEFLKKKPQPIAKIKAREIFKEIVNEEGTFPEFNYVSLIGLCDSYLKEASNTNDLKLLDELHPYLTQLMDIAINQESYWLIVESYLFQAKLKLIIFEFDEAQDFLEQALFSAEKYSQDRLRKKVLNEQNKLSRNLDKWERLKASGAKMSDRMELAHVDEQIRILLQKRRYLKSINIQTS
ncbi:MAG: tetratricopeptide repeat protein [Candidatus Heimdallarchaeota archaeon]